MSKELDWKKFQFIITVQTALINNAINISLESNAKAKAKRHLFSATGTRGLMADAFRAAEQIPKSLSAMDAADQFIPFILGQEGAEEHDWFMYKPPLKQPLILGAARRKQPF
jgi:hypothetical protein